MKNRFYFDTKPNENILELIKAEREEIGFYELCHNDVSEYEAYAKSIDAQDIVVVGIGGSALGTSAIYKFLKYTNHFSKKLHVIETTDPLVITDEMEHMLIFLLSVNRERRLRRSLFINISLQS